MRKILPFVLFFFIAITGFSQSVTNLVATNFISLTVPQDYQGELNYLNSSNLIVKKKAGEVPHDTSYLASFPNLVSSVTLYQVDKGGTLTLTGNSLSDKNSTYIVIYDYTQTQTIQVNDTATRLNCYALIGISVRMVARVNTKSAGINLANLFGLGIAANSNKLTGSLEVRVNGVNSQQINSAIPVTTDLSPASISNALQSVATIKSHIYDASTKITPQFLAFSLIGNSKSDTQVDFVKLSEKVKVYKVDQ
jgi:hypothetical protein